MVYGPGRWTCRGLVLASFLALACGDGGQAVVIGGPDEASRSQGSVSNDVSVPVSEDLDPSLDQDPALTGGGVSVSRAADEAFGDLAVSSVEVSSLRVLAVDLVNERRRELGRSPLNIGDSVAAQLIAEESLASLALLEYTRDGLPIEALYTATGGRGYMYYWGLISGYFDVVSVQACRSPHVICSRTDAKGDLVAYVGSLLDESSPDDTDSFLFADWETLHVGVAYTDLTLVIILHLEHQTVTYLKEPEIVGGYLVFKVTSLNDTTIKGVDIHHYPTPPSTEALVSTKALSIYRPPDSGQILTLPDDKSIVADYWSIRGNSTSIVASIAEWLPGPGVYEIVVWADSDLPASQYFLDVGDATVLHLDPSLTPEALLDTAAPMDTATARSTPTTRVTTTVAGTATTQPATTTTQARVRAAVGVAAGSGHSCAIWTDRTVTCWGGNEYGQADPPAGEFTALAAGDSHSCGLRSDRRIVCWGGNEYGQADPPAGEFTALAAGDSHSCGLRSDGRIICWGDNRFGQADPHGGEFTAVAAGGGHACGLRTDRSVSCWGENFTGAAEPPRGEFVAVASGGTHACAIRTDHTVTCWGNNDTRQTDVPDGEFTAISVGGGIDEEANLWGRSCGLRSNGALTCWGSGRAGVPSGGFLSVAVGSSHSCGVRTDGSITCWGSNFEAQSEVPAGGFAAVDAGGGTCAIRLDQTVVCWGSNAVWGDDPSGAFVAVATGGGSGGSHGCGISPTGGLICWGHNLDGQAQPPDGQFEAVDSGVDHTCGLRTDGTIICWGSNVFGQSQPPAGQFTDVTAGSWHSCGLSADRTVVCWGHNRDQVQAPRQLTYSDQVPQDWDHSCTTGIDYGIGIALICWGDNQFGQTHSPQDEFLQVTAGGWHTCGLRPDRSVTCWGDNASGQSEPPNGQFVHVAAGGWHTCGLQTDHRIVCWGANGWGQTQPPDGQFDAVTVGDGHSCGLRTDRTIICWGRDSFTTAPASITASNR